MRNNKVNDSQEEPAANAASEKRFKKTRSPIPRRGQIKRKMATKAFQTLISVVSPAPYRRSNAAAAV